MLPVPTCQYPALNDKTESHVEDYHDAATPIIHVCSRAYGLRQHPSPIRTCTWVSFLKPCPHISCSQLRSRLLQIVHEIDFWVIKVVGISFQQYMYSESNRCKPSSMQRGKTFRRDIIAIAKKNSMCHLFFCLFSFSYLYPDFNLFLSYIPCTD